MTYAMMAKATKLMPLWRHKPSQNPRVVYTLVDEAMAVVDALMRISALSRRVTGEKTASCVQRELFQPMTRGEKKHRPSGCLAQPVSRFAPLEAYASRTTSRLGDQCI